MVTEQNKNNAILEASNKYYNMFNRFQSCKNVLSLDPANLELSSGDGVGLAS